MRSLRLWMGMLLLGCAIAGWSRARVESPPLIVGEYRVLKADFHVHMFPGDSALLAPWDTIFDARRQNLDVIALTPHNHVWTAKLGEWVAQQLGGPLVIVGQEVVTPNFHMLAIGVDQPIDWRQNAVETIAAIHAQGGVAIAAHPAKFYWPGYDEAALAQLDAAEVWHPEALRVPARASEFRDFAKRGRFAAIGDSDLHNIAPLGVFYTYVFVKNFTKQGVLEAIRQRRTVVFDGDRYYGDEELIESVKATNATTRADEPARLAWLSGRVGSVALLVLVVIGVGRRRTGA